MSLVVVVTASCRLVIIITARYPQPPRGPNRSHAGICVKFESGGLVEFECAECEPPFPKLIRQHSAQERSQREVDEGMQRKQENGHGDHRDIILGALGRGRADDHGCASSSEISEQLERIRYGDFERF